MNITQDWFSAKAPEPPRPEPLFFDDEPIASLLGTTPPSPPTPADVLALWQGNFDRSDSVARAIATILCKGESRVREIGGIDGIEQCLRNALVSAEANWTATDPRQAACLAALGVLAQLHGHLEEAEHLLRQALELQRKRLGSDHPETRATTERLAALLQEVGRTGEAERLRRLLAIEQLLHEGQDGESLRVQALELFQKGEYDEAERIYRHLITVGFEMSSTHCHLARIYFMSNRAIQAFQETELAWEHRRQAPAYVVPRILFLRVVCAMFDRMPLSSLLRELESALQEPGSCHVWTMQPVVHHLEPRFTTDQLTLLTALVEALSKPEKIRSLYAVPLWRDANSQELDHLIPQRPVNPDAQP